MGDTVSFSGLSFATFLSACWFCNQPPSLNWISFIKGDRHKIIRGQQVICMAWLCDSLLIKRPGFIYIYRKWFLTPSSLIGSTLPYILFKSRFCLWCWRWRLLIMDGSETQAILKRGSNYIEAGRTLWFQEIIRSFQWYLRSYIINDYFISYFQ